MVKSEADLMGGSSGYVPLEPIGLKMSDEKEAVRMSDSTIFMAGIAVGIVLGIFLALVMIQDQEDEE